MSRYERKTKKKRYARARDIYEYAYVYIYLYGINFLSFIPERYTVPGGRVEKKKNDSYTHADVKKYKKKELYQDRVVSSPPTHSHLPVTRILF